jgi:hypothetical protein
MATLALVTMVSILFIIQARGLLGKVKVIEKMRIDQAVN